MAFASCAPEPTGPTLVCCHFCKKDPCTLVYSDILQVNPGDIKNLLYYQWLFLWIPPNILSFIYIRVSFLFHFAEQSSPRSIRRMVLKNIMNKYKL